MLHNLSAVANLQKRHRFADVSSWSMLVGGAVGDVDSHVIRYILDRDLPANFEVQLCRNFTLSSSLEISDQSMVWPDCDA
jgi:hypothetical protein